MLQEPIRKAICTLCFACSIVFIACSASEEGLKEQSPTKPAQPSATEMMTNAMNDMKMQNDSLRLTITKLEQDNRSTVARSAELEMQLNDLKTKPAPPPVTTKSKFIDPRATYENALHLFNSRNYQDASLTLQQVLDGNMPVDLMDNCHYWLGECAYATKNFQQAIEHFQHVLTYKVSEKKDDAQIMIAHSCYGMGNKANAKDEYLKFLDKYPASPYAKRAKERLNKL